MIQEIKGGQSGVRFVSRGPNDDHILIQLLGEDDENWFKRGDAISSFWIDDLISTLQTAKSVLEQQAVVDEDGFGYRFPRSEDVAL